jgi:hypothetical protein
MSLLQILSWFWQNRQMEKLYQKTREGNAKEEIIENSII